jgi:hypothetical protein
MIGESKIQLGATYKDSVSGFEGVVTMSTRFLFACERVTLSKGFDEKKGEEICAVFDAAQLSFVKGPTNEIKKALDAIGVKEQPKPPAGPRNGGDRPTPSAIR